MIPFFPLTHFLHSIRTISDMPLPLGCSTLLSSGCNLSNSTIICGIFERSRAAFLAPQSLSMSNRSRCMRRVLGRGRDMIESGWMTTLFSNCQCTELEDWWGTHTFEVSGTVSGCAAGIAGAAEIGSAVMIAMFITIHTSFPSQKIMWMGALGWQRVKCHVVSLISRVQG